MIKFLDGDAISAKIIETIKEADEYLILISPFIKLTEKVKTEIKYLVSKKPDVEIEVVFGKNESNPSKSLRSEDQEFLKTLPNIRVSYVKELHAKIYCSEDRLMLSSMNLHEFSQANNYEAAFVIERKSLISSIVGNSAYHAWDDALEFVNKIVGKSSVIYQKGKVYKTSWLGLSSEVIEELNEDYTDVFFKRVEYKSSVVNGFCIRTGKNIPFNLKQPYCDEAYKSWKRYSNQEYKEKYCHYSGEISEGDTSFKSPILRKYWKEAKAKIGF